MEVQIDLFTAWVVKNCGVNKVHRWVAFNIQVALISTVLCIMLAMPQFNRKLESELADRFKYWLLLQICFGFRFQGFFIWNPALEQYYYYFFEEIVVRLG